MIRQLISIFRDSPNSFEGRKENERVILLLRRHPFHLLIKLGLLCLIGLVPIVILLTFGTYFQSNEWMNLFLFLASIWYLGLWLTAFHTLTLYTLNTVIITDHRIIDSDQHGLFDRKVSELHIHRIQDVTAHTSGIIETFLKFGNIVVQTAASERQFVFHQVPRPDEVKNIIMQITASKHSGIIPTVNNL